MDSLKFAFYLGLLVGDGSLSNRNNGHGYPTYSVRFFNTNKEFVDLFYNLHLDLFDEAGKISHRDRKNKKRLYEFNMYSRLTFDYLVNVVGIPSGKKSDIVRIPNLILSNEDIIGKYFFFGLLLSDGGINKNKSIGFHMASKGLLDDLNKLIFQIWKFNLTVKSIVQKNKYYSYQLNLKTNEGNTILKDICRDRITWYCTDSEELILLKCKP